MKGHVFVNTMYMDTEQIANTKTNE